MKNRYLLCCAIACAPAAAHAQSTPEIVVTGKAGADTAARPGGADSVPATDYDDSLAVSLRDALAHSPGIYAQPRFGQEVRLSIRGSGISRGFHMRGLTLLTDGIPINQADDNGDFQELDPQAYERIDVYRGGNALRFGGSTLGGAINAVSATGRSAPGLDLRLDGGGFGTVRGRVAMGFADATGDALISLSVDRSDGDRQHSRRSSVRLGGNAGVRIAPNIETRFYASVNHIRQDLPGSLTLSQALATPELSLPANFALDQERDIDSIRLQSQTTVTLGGGTLRFGGYFNAKQLFHPIFQVIDQKSNDRGVFASLDLDGRLGSVPVSLTLGTQARFGIVRARQYVNLSGERGALTADSRQRARTINTYAELRMTPLPGLTLTGGGIYTNGQRAVTNRLVPGNSAGIAYDQFAPKFGLLWEPVKGVQLYANANRSAELPGFGELVQAPLAGFVPVAPQTAWTYEIGSRGEIGPVRWDVSVYRADLRGEMLQFAVSPNVPAATFNAGATRHQGVEAGLDLRLGRFGQLRQTWLYSDFAFRRDSQYGDNRLPVVPRNLYRAELVLGREGLSLTPRFEWVPQGAWADYRNTLRVPGYALFGLRAEARIGRATLFVDARNLTGKRAVGDISAAVQATPATVAFYPVERRAVYAGVRMGF